MTDEQSTVVCVGVGGFGGTLLESVLRDQSAALAGVVDVNEAVRRETAARTGVPAFATVEEALDATDADCFVLATPNRFHREQALLLAERKKHLFVEKPIANTVREAAQMIAACREHGVVLAVGHNYRRRAAGRKLKELVDAGGLGRVVLVEAHYGHNRGTRLGSGEWRASRDACPALPLMQLGIHYVDTYQYLFGPIESVSARIVSVTDTSAADDLALCTFRFASGLVGSLASSYVTPLNEYLYVYGLDDIAFAHAGRLHLASGRKAGAPDITLAEVNSYDEEIGEFLRAARGSGSFEVTPADALRALAVVEAAIVSSDTGKPVDVDDILLDN